MEFTSPEAMNYAYEGNSKVWHGKGKKKNQVFTAIVK